jgi:beta-galactosidase
VYDFGDGGNEFSDFLNIKKYIQMAQEEDLLVLFRPGPYICAEWEFGGFPSWLLKDEKMHVRGSYAPFLNRVQIYYQNLLEQIYDLQFTRGGPIIGIQVKLSLIYNIYKLSSNFLICWYPPCIVNMIV